MRIENATTLVTGATGGLGEAIARALAARQANLILTARRTELLERLGGELGASSMTCDMEQRAQLEELAEAAGEVDVLVVNAGLSIRGRLGKLSLDEIDRMLDVNLRASILLTRLLLPGMLQRERGHIVFMSSFASRIASADVGNVYTATKFGVRGFALSLRGHLHGTGVSASVVNPGPVRNAGMFARADRPLRRPLIGTSAPQDAADAVVRAIVEDKGEISVGSTTLRAIATLAGVAPQLVLALTRRFGGASRVRSRPGGGQSSRPTS